MHQLTELTQLEDELSKAVLSDDVVAVRKFDAKIANEFDSLVQQMPASRADALEMISYFLDRIDPDSKAGGQNSRLRDRILNLFEISFDLPK